MKNKYTVIQLKYWFPQVGWRKHWWKTTNKWLRAVIGILERFLVAAYLKFFNIEVASVVVSGAAEGLEVSEIS